MRRPLHHIAVLAFLAGCTQPPLVTTPLPLSAPTSFADAVSLVARRQAADDSVVVTGGRSLLLTHGVRTPRVFVLLHGFTDLPEQFAVVGQHLFSAGDNVYIPRLPRHGARRAPMRSLGRIRAEELARFGDSCVTIASGLGDSIIVVGLSAGGAVAASVAQSHAEVRRAVLIAPAIAAGLISDDAGHGLVVVASRLPEITRTNAPIDSSRSDFVQGITTHGLAQVLRLGEAVREASAAREPAAKNMSFLLNEADHTVSDAAAVNLAQNWSARGAHVSVHRFPASLALPHNVMETDARGGNVALVFPVIEALALGVTPPNMPEQVLEVHRDVCTGWRCALKRAMTP
jgi:alpha-beta hydrolase superfamily lysophospholipase